MAYSKLRFLAGKVVSDLLVEAANAQMTADVAMDLARRAKEELKRCDAATATDPSTRRRVKASLRAVIKGDF